MIARQLAGPISRRMDWAMDWASSGGCQLMFTSNPFAELSAFIPAAVMQTYVVVMILLVAGGTLLDIMHKQSARYFFDNWRRVANKGTRQVRGVEMASLAIQTAVVEGLT